MRFACDRCKTRYSIADERVRGKILKIRCKSCANVITVKEGMDAPPETGAVPAVSAAGDRSGAVTTSGLPERPEWSPSVGAAIESAAASSSSSSAATNSPSQVGGRAFRPTTMAPQSTVGSGGVAPLTPAPKPAAALGAAFASAMAGAQAPAQLEDEWYVSRDGDQHGPFNLNDAQAWVSQQPYDAELFCWCEGFDDWLPVDRIAHFRGLRARPTPPSAPPSGPLPRPAPLVAPSSAVTPAAAMAAVPAPGLSNRPPISGPLPLLGRTPSRPTGANPIVPTNGALADDKPQFAASMAALGGAAAGATGTGSTNAAPPRGGFDAGDLGDVGGQGFSSEGPRRSAIGSSNPVPPAQASPASSSPFSALPGTDSDDLEFGEVSRVVRIADIGKTMRPQARASTSSGASGLPGGANATPPKSLPPVSTSFAPASAPPLSGTGTGSHGIVGAPLGGGESVRVPVPLVIPAAQRRNHALLLGVVAVGLIGAGVAAFFLLSSSEPEDPAMISLSGVDVSDLTIRPDEPRRGSGATTEPEQGSGDGTAAPTRPTNPTGVKRPVTPTNPGNTGTTPGGKIETAPTPGAAGPLGADEVEAMSQKNSSGLQRCYEAALKKDIFLEVKSIKVTLSIDASGVVTNVAMSSHADHPLGQCMISRIRNWRFRANSRGLDAKFTVAFGRST